MQATTVCVGLRRRGAESDTAGVCRREELGQDYSIPPTT